jgi:hypothetical protein
MTKCFAGLDWASRTHAVCVIDQRGAVRTQFEVNHESTMTPPAWPSCAAA